MKLHYLHLSDLHFTHSDMRGDRWAANAFDQSVAAKSMLRSVEELVKKGPNFDFIVITGDVAKRGKREEYRVAEIFTERLLEITGLPRRRLYLVPGNHDVNRADIKPVHLKRWYPFEDQEEITELLADPESLNVFTSKFAEFNNFAEKAMGRRHYDESTYHIVESAEMEKGGRKFRVNLMGLNSCLFAGYDGDDQQKLALGLFQVDRALGQLDENALFSIGFFHHPFSCFHATDKISRTRLVQKLDLILYGHLHQPVSEAFRSTAGEAVLIGAGAAYEARESENSFNTVEIDIATGEGKVRFFKYLPDHDLWKRNTDVNPHSEDGSFAFTLTSTLKSPLEFEKDGHGEKEAPSETIKEERQGKTETYFIHDYKLPDEDQFVGRGDEIKRLTALIRGEPDPETNKSASLITVRGKGGIGKSCLIRKVVEGFREGSRFRTIVWFSFYEARTDDEGWFFQRILEELGLASDTPGEGGGAVRAGRLRERLCNHLDRVSCLLILDGLEVIQHTDDHAGHRHGGVQVSHGETDRLLSHLCNLSVSAGIVTTRVTLAEFSGIHGYLEFPLDFFGPRAGASFLERLGVQGDKEELMRCAALLGGHPLCLKAAGRFMAKKVPAQEVKKIMGDPALFKQSTEGERLSRIVNNYREGISAEQEYFLTMLSIHPRSVTEKNFPALVRGYEEEEREKVLDEIITPLLELGLLEELYDAKGGVSYNAHPLMKLAFSRWLKEGAQVRVHEEWAETALASPDIDSDASHAKSLEELQPYLDIVEHYLDAGNFKEAWAVYRDREVDRRLNELGYAHHILKFGGRFEKELEQGKWSLDPGGLVFLYNFWGMVYSNIQQMKEYLECNKKAFHAARETGDKNKILDYGSILAQSHILSGQTHEAKGVLDSLGEIAKGEGEEEGYAIEVYKATRAGLELFSGNYSKAVSLFPEKFSFSDKHNDILRNLYLAEALLRFGQLDKAEIRLRGSLNEAEANHMYTLKPVIFVRLTWLMLKQNNILDARNYNDQRTALQKSLDLPHEDDGFLLVREGKYDQTIREAAPYLSTEGEEKFDKATEIENLLILAQAWYEKGAPEKAEEYFDRATALMKKTGCWREKDTWEETREILKLKEETMKLPISGDDFETIIREGYFYIDKTLLIKEIWECSADVLLIPRPRRFGKTLNLSMLQCFFERTLKNKEPLFRELNITRWDKFRELHGKFPVISLTFKDVKGNTWEECLGRIKKALAHEYRRHEHIRADLPDWDKEEYEKILRLKGEIPDYEDSLKNLTEYLFRFYGQKPMVLLDEYDMPLQELFRKPKEYDPAVHFFRNLLSAVLKDNKYLEKGVLTGILRTAKESVFSGLNNLKIYSLLSDKFADKFGFTREETARALADFHLAGKMSEVEDFYNGYSIGNTKVYNPWSVINYLDEKEFKPFWIKSSSNTLIQELIIQNKDAVRDKVISLLNNESIAARLDEDIVFSEIYRREDNVWNFLTFTGYLTFAKLESEGISPLYNLSIPNTEVKLFFKETIREWLEDVGLDAQIKALRKALLAGDVPAFEKDLQEIAVRVVGIRDTAKTPEIFYHAFVLGLLVNLEDRYEIDSNRESGTGYYDMMLVPRNADDLGIVLEFKRAEKTTGMEKAMGEARKQIIDRNYAAKLKDRGIKNILGIGVVFCGKKVRAEKAY